MADQARAPFELMPSPSPRKYWTRRGIAEWLVELLAEEAATLVGIAHGFSFPLRYFAGHNLEPDWPAFLDDFQRHWPTDGAYLYVDFIRDGLHGNGAPRRGNPCWRRLTDEQAGAKSLFQFDAPGSVAKATHAGLPWLRFIRRQIGGRVHFWAVRRLGDSSRALGGGRGLSRPVEPDFRAPAAIPISTMPTRAPPGCAPPTATAASPATSCPRSPPPSGRSHRSRDGFSEWWRAKRTLSAEAARAARRDSAPSPLKIVPVLFAKLR